MYYGFDIGGTKIELVVFDDDFSPVKKERVLTPTDNYESFLTAISTLVEDADQEFGDHIKIGLGVPGIESTADGTLLSTNIPAASGKVVSSDLQKRLKRPITINNDCKCFTYSEAVGGAGKDFKIVFGAILGTGVGGGLCIDGHLIKGKNGIAGEWGHSPLPGIFVEKYGLPLNDCACGLKGCIEHYISGTGLANLYTFCSENKITTQKVIEKMRNNDPDALKAFAIFIDVLACSLSIIIHHYDPDCIVFGGGLSNVDELYEQLPKALERYLLSGVEVPALLAPKFGDSSGVRGAAMLGGMNISSL